MSDAEQFLPPPSSRPPSPPTSPFTSPLKATTTPKRPFQGSQDTPLSCRRRKFSKFANSRILSSHSEYGSDDALSGTGSPTAAKEASRSLRRSYHLRQLKRSSLHLEKRLVSQRIQEHEISLQALKERMFDINEDIASSTLTVGSLHCYMDQVGVPIPDMPNHIVSSIYFSEDDETGADSQDQNIFGDLGIPENQG